MSTPTRAQARRQQARQSAIVALAVKAQRRLFAASPQPTVPEIASTAARYQTAAALASTTAVAGYADDRVPVTVAQAFAGVSSIGFSLTEPIIATIDRIVPAPVAPLPAPWWESAAVFMAALEQLIASEVADAGRAASQVEATGRGWTSYIRMLNPPSCDRCTILAGRVYRWNEGFARHPLCDCIHVPVDNRASAEAEGLIADPREAFEKGLVRGLSRADAQAIADGADMSRVVNAYRGLRAPGVTAALRTEMFGHKVKATTEATTRRSAWRKANPSRLVRLRPESIYNIADDQADAVRMLKLYGYIL